MSNLNLVNELEIKELLDKLRYNGHEELVDTFLLNENKVYTKNGRLNKSAACREMGIKPKQLEDMFNDMRQLLEQDLSESEV